MTDRAFYGRIYSGEVQQVAGLLERWIAPGSVRTKIRISGEEIEYEDERLRFYSHNAAGEPPNFLLEGSTSASLDETRRMLEALLALCRDAQVTATFDYVEVDENGEEVSEEFSIG